MPSGETKKPHKKEDHMAKQSGLSESDTERIAGNLAKKKRQETTSSSPPPQKFARATDFNNNDSTTTDTQ